MKIIAFDKKILGVVEDNVDYLVPDPSYGFIVYNTWYSPLQSELIQEIEISEEDLDAIGGEELLKQNYEINTSLQYVKKLDFAFGEFREERNKLLEESDKESKVIWSDLWDNMEEADKTAWSTYRQNLRDAPSNIAGLDDINNYVWPTKPS